MAMKKIILILTLCLTGCSATYISNKPIPQDHNGLVEYVVEYTERIEQQECIVKVAEKSVSDALQYDNHHWGDKRVS